MERKFVLAMQALIFATALVFALRLVAQRSPKNHARVRSRPHRTSHAVSAPILRSAPRLPQGSAEGAGI